MIASKSKEDDKMFRDQLLLLTRKAAWHYAATGDERFLKHANALGSLSKQIKERLAHGDYAEREKRRKLVDDVLAKHYV